MKTQWTFVCILATQVTLCSAANAAPEATKLAPNDAALNRALAAEELFEKGQLDKAFTLYSEADALSHSPMVVLCMARCKGNMGELVAASQLYKRVIDDPFPAAAGKYMDAQKEAQKQAKDELESLQKRIARILVILTNANDRNVRVTIDGWQQGTIDKPIEVDPGKHTIVITWDEDHRYTREMTVAEGKSEIFAASLRPKVVKSEPSLLVPGLIMGVGGIAVLGGILTTIYAKDTWESCSKNSCATDQAYAKNLDTGATYTLVGGVTTFAVGAIWLGLLRDSKRTRKSARSSILPVITPSGVFLTGTF